MAEFLNQFVEELPALIAGILATLIITWLNIRPGLRVFFTPSAEFHVDEAAGAGTLGSVFRVESLLVRNNNFAKAVTQIEITFAYKPAAFSVNPSAAATEQLLDTGQWVLTLPTVQPREQIKIDVSYFGVNAPVVSSVRSSEGPKRAEPANYISVVPAWRVWFLFGVAALGVITLWRVFWQIVQNVWALAPTL